MAEDRRHGFDMTSGRVGGREGWEGIWRSCEVTGEGALLRAEESLGWDSPLVRHERWRPRPISPQIIR